MFRMPDHDVLVYAWVDDRVYHPGEYKIYFASNKDITGSGPAYAKPGDTVMYTTSPVTSIQVKYYPDGETFAKNDNINFIQFTMPSSKVLVYAWDE